MDNNNKEQSFLQPENALPLYQKNNWVNWKMEKKNGRNTKIPYSPNNYKASSTDKDTWSSFGNVINTKHFDGVGIVFDGTILGIDLDKILVNGKIVDEPSQKLLQLANTYVEISPSGTGLHILFELTEDFQLTRNSYNSKRKSDSGDIKYEFYNSRRFFTFTGNEFEMSRLIRTINKTEAEELLKILGYPFNNISEQTEHATRISNKTSEVVLNALLKEEKHQRYFNLDDSAKNGDTSDADMAFMCGIRDLADRDPVLMKEVFLLTPRSKRSKVINRTDYLDRLVNDSLQYKVNTRSTLTYKNEKQVFTPPKILTIKEVYELYKEDPKWIVENMLIEGGISINASKPKLGKSTLIRNLITQVSLGLDFLGRKTTKGYVLYISLEESGVMVRKHYQAMGIDQNNENIGSVTASYLGDNPAEWIESVVIEKQPKLIVIDTLGHYIGDLDFNDYGKVLGALRPLLYIARKYKTHICLIHHARKMGGQDGDIILGSTGLLSIVDTAIYLKKDLDGKRYLSTQQRYGEDLEETLLEFDKDTQTLSLGITKKFNQVHKIKSDILDLLKDGHEYSEKEIQSNIGGKTTDFRISLRELANEKKINKNGKGRRGGAYMYSKMDADNSINF